MTEVTAHVPCWTGTEYDHRCQKPSGRECYNCGAPAGTLWGPYWCPDCDVERLVRITESLDEIQKGI